MEPILHLAMWEQEVRMVSHPLCGCVGARGWKGCPWGTHPPPLRKVTSCHLHPGPHFLLGFPKALVEDLWGVHSTHRVQPPGRDPPEANAILSQLGHQGLPGGGAEFPHLGGDFQQLSVVSPPPLRVELGFQKVCHPLWSCKPLCGLWKGQKP